MPGCTHPRCTESDGDAFKTSDALDIHYRDTHMLPSPARFDDANKKKKPTKPAPKAD